MKILKKINLFFFRIDGIISLLFAVISFVALIQCALAVQSGLKVLFLPCMVLMVTCVCMLLRFFDWLLFVDRRTRFKIVKRKVNTILETWRMEKYKNENEK